MDENDKTFSSTNSDEIKTKIEIFDNKENIVSLDDDDISSKQRFRLSANLLNKVEHLYSGENDEKDNADELKESTSQMLPLYVDQRENSYLNSILINGQTNDNGELGTPRVRSKSLFLATVQLKHENQTDSDSGGTNSMETKVKKVKKVIFADQVILIRGDERLQIPLTRISSAGDTSNRFTSFSKLLTNKIEETTVTKIKSKKIKFQNESSRKNSLTTQMQAGASSSASDMVDSNTKVKSWNLFKENTFYGIDKETSVHS